MAYGRSARKQARSTKNQQEKLEIYERIRKEGECKLLGQIQNTESADLKRKIAELKERIYLESKFPPGTEMPSYKEFADTPFDCGMARDPKRQLWRARRAAWKMITYNPRTKDDAQFEEKLKELELSLKTFELALEEREPAGSGEMEELDAMTEVTQSLMTKSGRKKKKSIEKKQESWVEGYGASSKNQSGKEKMEDTDDKQRQPKRETVEDENNQRKTEKGPETGFGSKDRSGRTQGRTGRDLTQNKLNTSMTISREAGTASIQELTPHLEPYQPTNTMVRHYAAPQTEEKIEQQDAGEHASLEQMRLRLDALKKRREGVLVKIHREETSDKAELTNWDRMVQEPMVLEQALNELPGEPEENSEIVQLKARRQALMKQRQETLLELQKHKIPGTVTNPDLQLENLIPKGQVVSAEERSEQLNNISQSIAFLKKFTSKAKAGDASSKTAEAMGVMLEDLQKEALEVPVETEKQAEEETGNEDILTRTDNEPIIKRTNKSRPDRLSTPQKASAKPFHPATDTQDAIPSSESKSQPIFGSAHKPSPIPPSWPKPQNLGVSLTEGLKPQIHPTLIEIDPTLTINLEAPISDLQSQIFQMRERLQNAYPRIENLPYDVWTSSNRTTLRTWLRILVSKWQTRFDDVPRRARDQYVSNGTLDDDVQKVLDHMVVDHDLSSEAAKRMGQRWEEVFKRKGVPEDIRAAEEEGLDWNEFDPGLEWLKDENPVGELERNMMSTMDASALQALSFTPDSKDKGGIMGTGVQTRRLHTLGPASRRCYSTRTRPPLDKDQEPPTEDRTTAQSTEPKIASSEAPSLPHLTASGTAHMVSVASKQHTLRTAIAVGKIFFSNPIPLTLIRNNSLKKGDVLSVSRIAGIMAAKKCPDIVPLCHPIMLTHVGVDLSVFSGGDVEGGDTFGGVNVEAKVQCEGQTGVEMEALTAVMGAALSVVDMCKAVDKGMRVEEVRVVLKEGGRSGVWREEGWSRGL
jgi:molybdenum cofactor biosynthesis protein MoaC